MQKLRREKQPEFPQLSWEKVGNWVSEHLEKVIASIVVVFLLLFFLTPSGKAPKASPAGSSLPPVTANARKKVVPAFEAGQIRDVKGIVQLVFADGIEIKILVPLEVVFAQWTGKRYAYQVGEVFRGRIKLIRLEKSRWRAEIELVY